MIENQEVKKMRERKLEDYVSYLVSKPLRTSCRRLGKILSINHDSVNRFLWREDLLEKK
jgi:hypothetical protein